MIKVIETFMNKEDEKRFSKLLLETYPQMAFLDDSLWPSGKVELSESINDCTSNFCYIWNKALNPNLPTGLRSNGWADGPKTGLVIQFQRSLLTAENILLSGRIAASYSDMVNYHEYTKNVFKMIRKLCKTGVYTETEFGGIVDKSSYSGGYIVGRSVLEDLASSNINRLKANNTDVYFCPKSLVE